MGTKASRKNFYMEIRKSPGRFLSIFFIVALGVAFFSGIRSSEPSMRITGDAYFDGANLMDIQVMSTLGITEDDIDAIEKVDGVELAEGSYSSDFLCNTEDKQYVFHVMSLTDEVNEVSVSEGRLPEKTGECLMDADMGYEVGDKIVLTSGTEDPLEDTLKTDTYTVVGIGSSPCYVSIERGSTTIGSGSVSAFMMVPEETFALDVYTEAYVKVEGASNLTAYTDEYDSLVSGVMDRIEEITGEQGEIRKNEILEDAQEEIDEGRKELEEGRAEADQELADALAQITDGENQLADAKAQLESGRQQLEAGKEKLISSQNEIDSAKSQYESGLSQWKAGQAEYESGLAEYNASKPAAEEEIRQGEGKLQASRQELDKNWEEYQSFLDYIAQMDTTVSDAEQKVQELTAELSGYEEDSEAYKECAAKLEKAKTKLAELQGKRDTAKGQAEGMLEGLNAGETAYQAGVQELEAAKKQLSDGAAQLEAAKSTLDATKAQLDSAWNQIQSGQKQIDDGWAEINAQEKNLESGEAQIAENEAKLADARKEYESGKAEAEQELADGEQELLDAEEQLADVEDPEWYIYDRSNLVEYDGYGENADRMRAIGRVFPVLFFLVAALISLTSMTRMVEEQRIEIGTMKALGYDRFAIAAKYLGYALLATVGGSIVGVLIGEKILPFIIIYAYGILYQHIPEILVPYAWSYAIQASAAALACTMLATLFACYKELGEQPASLMRPPAPKIGKRVFLEHVTFIWKRLSFTWKSTVRNLMRYKKRFFMTIFGIGGCMALIVVGFGLRDSIYEIADIQYEEIQTYDGSAYLQENVTEEDRENLDTFMKEDSDIERYMDAYMMNVTLEHGSDEHDAYLTILADPDKSEEYFSFHDRISKEEYRLSDHGAIISEKTAKLLNAEVGDTIRLKDEENGSHELTIEHICENYMGHYIYMTPSYYEEVTGAEPEYNCILFQTDESFSKEEMEEAGEKIVARDEVLSVSYMHDIEKQLDDMLGSLNLVIVVLIVSAGMLAFVVLYNLNTINITERQRELATLKVLGFYDREVAEYVYRENILLTLIGVLVGVGLGKVLHLFIIETVEVDAAMFGRIINLPSYIYSLAFTVAFSLIVNGVMFFKLRKIDMVESLKSIE